MRSAQRLSQLFALLLVATFVLSACGSAATPTSAPAQPTKAPVEPTKAPPEPTKAPPEPTKPPATPAQPPVEKVTLQVWRPAGAAVPTEGAPAWWDDKGEIVGKWLKDHPNIEIKIEDIPFEQFDTKELTALKGGGAPDVMFVNHVTVGAVAGTGGVEPLETCISSQPSIDPKDWIPGMWAVGTQGGKQVTLPWDTDTRILWSNKKLLKEAGVTTAPTTWDELLAAVKKVNAMKKPNVSGWGYTGGSYWGVLYQDIGPWLVQMNTSFLTPDGNASAALDPNTVKAFKFAVELAKYAPEGAVNYTNEMDARFANGQQAFYVWGMWYSATLKKTKPDWKLGEDYDIALLPGPEAGKTGSSNGGWQFAIAKESKHKKEACAFLAFVTSTDMMALGTQAHIPTRLSAQKASYFKGDPVVEKSLEQAAYGHPPVPPVPELPEIAQLVQRQFIRAVTGEITADNALQEIDKEIKALLAKRS